MLKQRVITHCVKGIMTLIPFHTISDLQFIDSIDALAEKEQDLEA